MPLDGFAPSTPGCPVLLNYRNRSPNKTLSAYAVPYGATKACSQLRFQRTIRTRLFDGSNIVDHRKICKPNSKEFLSENVGQLQYARPDINGMVPRGSRIFEKFTLP